MAEPSGSDLLFDLPRVRPREEAEALLADLAMTWEAQYGPLGDLQSDLSRMRDRLFRPIARERTLRQNLIHDLQRVPTVALPPMLGVKVGFVQLITPEGRLMIEILERVLQDRPGTPVDIDAESTSAYERHLCDTYREWSRERLYKVIDLTAGEGAPLLPGPLGVVMMILVEGAVGRENALRQSLTDKNAEEAVIQGVAAFARVIDPQEKWDAAQFSLYSGYGISEACRRISAIVVEWEQSDGSSRAKRVYIERGREHEVLDFLARDFARRRISSKVVQAATQAMLDAYGECAPSERVKRATARASQLREELASLSDAEEPEEPL